MLVTVFYEYLSVFTDYSVDIPSPVLVSKNKPSAKIITNIIGRYFKYVAYCS